MRTTVICCGIIAFMSAAAAEPPCTASTSAGQTCGCDVRLLRPLQGAIGLDEVTDKVDKIQHQPRKAWRDLENNPIKIVHGPGGMLFIVDHHHGADAWRLAGHPMALCQIVAGPFFGTEAAFWQGLADDRLVRLADADGRPVTPGQLPISLEQMPDDPYRSLAWRLRKAGGFCRSEMDQKEFAEFIWADWMRGQPTLPAAQVHASGASMVEKALALARSPAAKALPGYVGDKPQSFACAKED